MNITSYIVASLSIFHTSGIFYFSLFMQAILLLEASELAFSYEQLAGAEAGIQEYCTSEESFEGSCLKNEVIVMTSAIYGRMKIGRCLEDEEVSLHTAFGSDPKFLGCSDNVLALMDKKCSGKSRCEVRLNSDTDFRKFKPCLTALKLYLEASYRCITVIEPDRSCVVIATSNPLHIMSSPTTNLGCGTYPQPWVIEAPTGQQINVSLLEFGLDKTTQATQFSNSCEKYGSVFEKLSGKNISICGHGQERNTMVYKSHSNSIEVVLDAMKMYGSGVEQPRILIGFHAIGCSNLIPPEEAWLRRNDNEATIGCYSSRQTWHLRCTENQWIGVFGNCTQDFTKLDEVLPEKIPTSLNVNQVTIMVVVVFLTLIICLTIICCGAVCLKRHYSRSARQHFQLIEENYKKFNIEDGQMHNKPILVMDAPLRLA